MYKMKILVLLLCLMIGGSIAYECDEIRCADTPLTELEQLDYKVNETDLIRLCPPTLELFKCYSKFAKDCFEMEIEEIAETGDVYAKIIATKILEARNLAVEMCDEQSTLRKNYLENLDCVARLADDASSICSEKADLETVAFLRKLHNLKEEDHVNWSERICLERVYVLACFAQQLESTCGEGARRTFLIILEKIKSVVRTECNVVDSLNFKQSFFEYLQLEGEISEIYRFVFQTF